MLLLDYSMFCTKIIFGIISEDISVSVQREVCVHLKAHVLHYLQNITKKLTYIYG